MRKQIREVRIEGIEDVEALPEGEWVSVPAGGFKLPLVFDNLVTIDGVQYVPMPASRIHRFGSAVVEWVKARRSPRQARRAE